MTENKRFASFAILAALADARAGLAREKIFKPVAPAEVSERRQASWYEE